MVSQKAGRILLTTSSLFMKEAQQVVLRYLGGKIRDHPIPAQAFIATSSANSASGGTMVYADKYQHSD